jgi:ABC-2 type transport system permease protein
VSRPARTLTIARKDLKQIVADKKAALYFVVMPIAFTAFLGFALGMAEEEARPRVLVLADQEVREDAAPLLELLAEPGGLEVSTLPPSARTEATDEVKKGEVAVALLLTAEHLSRLRAGQGVDVEAIADDTLQEANLALRAVEAALFQAAVVFRSEDPALAIRAWRAREGVSRVAVTEAGYVAAPAGFEQASPGILVQFAIMSLLATASILVQERRSGTLERMLAGSVTRTEVVLGHGLAVYAVSMVQMLILVVVGALFFGVEYGRSPLAVTLTLLCFGVFLAALGLCIGAFSRQEDHVVLLSLAAMFVLAGLGGCWVPLEIMGGVVQTVGHLMPSAWAMDAFQNVVVRGQGLSSVLWPCAVMLGWSLPLWALAIWRLSSRAATRA